MNSNGFFEKIDRQIFFKYLESSVIRAQKCQRNWDLSKTIPQEDIDLIINAATNCPSKQNMNLYKLHVITDRDKIEEIYELTETFSGHRKNPQVLAHLLLAFEEADPTEPRSSDAKRLYWNGQSKGDRPTDISDEERQEGLKSFEGDKMSVRNDRNQAIGVAAGFSNMVATVLGYNTGCCKCLHQDGAKTILGNEQRIALMMGIGIKDETKPRREDHDQGQIVESFSKLPIEIIRHQ
jgi:nitroreductase